MIDLYLIAGRGNGEFDLNPPAVELLRIVNPFLKKASEH